MPSQTILLIRHAEKPDDTNAGNDPSGAADSESLTPRGWQRAGVWAEIFAPSFGQNSFLPTLDSIFASAPVDADDESQSGNSKSRRPLETITPVSEKLGLGIDRRFGTGSVDGLVKAISECEGNVLVCWQHEDIVTIASSLTPVAKGIPKKWPGNRFNIIFRLDRSNAGSQWVFQQLLPVMLNGDSPTPI